MTALNVLRSRLCPIRKRPQGNPLSGAGAGLVFLMALALLALAMFASAALGVQSLLPEDYLMALTGGVNESLNSAIAAKRMVRMLFAAFAGASLGMAGALMQAVTRNPIADPGILGINLGASLAVVIGTAFFNIGHRSQFMALAVIGAALAAAAVYGIASLGRGNVSPLRLALSGAAVSAALSSVVSAVVLPRSASLADFRFWQIGSVGGASMEDVYAVLPFVLGAALLGLISAPAFNALALGDDAARGLGASPGRTRLIGAAAGVILCGATTALAGPIGYIGLLGAHAARSLGGRDYRTILPLSALFGAAILCAADAAGRFIARPAEIETGIVTAFIGAPMLVFIALRTRNGSV